MFCIENVMSLEPAGRCVDLGLVQPRPVPGRIGERGDHASNNEPSCS
jgi:hypothetical protein